MYPAKTSTNKSYHTFKTNNKLLFSCHTHARKHRCTDAWTHGRTDARTHGRTDARTHGRTDARTHGRTHDVWEGIEKRRSRFFRIPHLIVLIHETGCRPLSSLSSLLLLLWFLLLLLLLLLSSSSSSSSSSYYSSYYSSSLSSSSSSSSYYFSSSVNGQQSNSWPFSHVGIRNNTVVQWVLNSVSLSLVWLRTAISTLPLYIRFGHYVFLIDVSLL